MSPKPTVLVTGVTGFIGSHVAVRLIETGYAVRGTVRAAKKNSLQASACQQYPDLALVALEDVATGDISQALDGVESVIHVATPLGGRTTPDVALQTAVEGTLNILRQAVDAGIKTVVLTSSWGTTMDPSLGDIYTGKHFVSTDWGRATREDILNGNKTPFWIYLATKILAERAAWKFAEEHPELNLITIHPPYVYGPIAPGFPLPSASGLGSNTCIFSLISGQRDRPLHNQVPPHYCDVRDVAKAHVAALRVSQSRLGKQKRYLLSGGIFFWPQAVALIRKERPYLEDRFPSLENAFEPPGPVSTIDIEPAKGDLGVTEYISWEDTVKDTVESLLKVEESWTA